MMESTEDAFDAQLQELTQKKPPEVIKKRLQELTQREPSEVLKKSTAQADSEQSTHLSLVAAVWQQREAMVIYMGRLNAILNQIETCKVGYEFSSADEPNIQHSRETIQEAIRDTVAKISRADAFLDSQDVQSASSSLFGASAPGAMRKALGLQTEIKSFVKSQFNVLQRAVGAIYKFFGAHSSNPTMKPAFVRTYLAAHEAIEQLDKVIHPLGASQSTEHSIQSDLKAAKIIDGSLQAEDLLPDRQTLQATLTECSTLVENILKEEGTSLGSQNRSRLDTLKSMVDPQSKMAGSVNVMDVGVKFPQLTKQEYDTATSHVQTDQESDPSFRLDKTD